MSARRAPLDVRLVTSAVTAGALCAVLFGLVLSALAHPSGLQAGLGRISTRAATLEAALQAPGDPFAYPAHALCTANPNAAAPAMTAKLSALAAADGVALANLSATPGVEDEAAGGIVPITIQFNVTGRYDQILGLLDTLSRAQPKVFVDAADLKSETSAVSLTFQGRIFCSPPVPL